MGTAAPAATLGSAAAGAPGLGAVEGAPVPAPAGAAAAAAVGLTAGFGTAVLPLLPAAGAPAGVARAGLAEGAALVSTTWGKHQDVSYTGQSGKPCMARR